jgi:PKD repeat protein
MHGFNLLRVFKGEGRRMRRSISSRRRVRPFLEFLEGRIALSSVNAAVWLDGNTTPGGGGNGILTSLSHAFGPNSFTLVTTSQLDTPGFLAANGFNVVIVSRYDAGFGTFLDPTAASNIQAYVGAANSSGQGGVALFTNDVADNLYGASGGDPFDPNLDQLFTNAVQFAANTGHGYIGEFNGAVMAMTSNTAGASPIGLLTGSANAVHFTNPPFVYEVGPIGGNNPIDSGVTFPFTDADQSTYRTDITGADSGNIVDVYQDNNLPAVLADQAVISGGGSENQNAIEGIQQSFNLGSFTDPNPGPWNVDVDWGDNQSHTQFSVSSQGSLGSQNHTYAEEGMDTVTVTVTNTNTQASIITTFTVTVGDAALHATSAAISPVAGAPFSGVVASFTDDNPTAPLSDYSATIDWGDGQTTPNATITPNGSGGYNVSGSHTYTNPGSDTVKVVINDVGGSSATAQLQITVANLGTGVQPGQTATIGFWQGPQGQSLINKFGTTTSGQTLGQWLATTLPNLYGGVSGAPNLYSYSDAQIAAFDVTLFSSSGSPKLDAQIFDTALDVFATTSSLGGTTATAYGFTVNAYGLGAYSWNIGSSGAAFGVPNNTTLNVYQMLQAMNQYAVGGEPWGTNQTMRKLANVAFDGLNQAGDI